MHAVVVRVTVSDPEKAQKALQEEVAPRASQSPGFRAGYWTRLGNEGLSMVLFDSEDAAREAAARVPQMVPEFVTLEGVEVREVVAQA